MNHFSRRDFLKLGAAGFGALLLPKIKLASANLPDFPTGENLGRLFATYDVMSKPDIGSTVIKTLYQDNVINIYREVMGTTDLRYYRSRTWYETDEGFIYAPDVQPVKNILNQPLATLPSYGDTPGFWAEVTVPYVELQLDGAAPKSPLLIELMTPPVILPLRFYYSQVLWIDGKRTLDDGTVQYHVIEKHGSYGDKFWADARAFKPLSPEELSPIRPEVLEKKIVVDVTRQTLSAFEGSREVFYTSVSTGALINNEGQSVTGWATPIGDYHVVNRKYVSLHMAGGSESASGSGYEDFAVGYTSIFATGGVALHSTHWHNAWGSPMSHGCVNMKPEDSKFIYLWTQPAAPYYEGVYEQAGYDGTHVQVVE